jgi:hypothetical protein
MGLTDQQIERYARQIIVPGIGGIAQERLLAARMMLVGDQADIGLVLPYFVGAGIGQIRLLVPGPDSNGQNALIARARDLNTDVTVSAIDDIKEFDLVFAIGAQPLTGASIAITVPPLCEAPSIIVSLAEPPTIAIATSHPPCPLCADLSPMTLGGGRGDTARFVAMVAAAEALKFLTRLLPPSPPALLQFNRFECVSSPLRRKQPMVPCTCGDNQ